MTSPVVIMIIVFTTTLRSSYYSHFTSEETDVQGLNYLVRVAQFIINKANIGTQVFEAQETYF